MKGKKKKKKLPSMITKASKVIKKDDDKDQNFFKKPQMDKASRMAPPDAADENFYEKFIELMNSPSETDVDCQIHDVQEVKNEVEVDGTNIDDNNDLQEMQNMIEDTFQPMFKTEWEKVIEGHPTWSVIDDKLRHMYIKCQEELTKCITYKRMLTEVMKETTMTQEKLHLLMDKLGSLMKDKHANSEKEVKVVNAAIEEEKAVLRCLEILGH